MRFLGLKTVQAEGLAARQSGCAQSRGFMRSPAGHARRLGSRSRTDRPCPGCCLTYRQMGAPSAWVSSNTRVSRLTVERLDLHQRTVSVWLPADHRQLEACGQTQVAHAPRRASWCTASSNGCASAAAREIRSTSCKTSSGSSQRVARAGAAVHQLGQVHGALHDGVANLAAHDHTVQGC